MDSPQKWTIHGRGLQFQHPIENKSPQLAPIQWHPGKGNPIGGIPQLGPAGAVRLARTPGTSGLLYLAAVQDDSPVRAFGPP